LLLICDIVTRWWSTYKIAERRYALRNFINILVDTNKVKQADNLTPEVWKELEQLLHILKPFMLVQQLLEGEKYVTISMVPRTIYAIRKALEDAIQPGKYVAHVEALSRKLLADFVIRQVESPSIKRNSAVPVQRAAPSGLRVHR
jgi:hypothetical protein